MLQKHIFKGMSIFPPMLPRDPTLCLAPRLLSPPSLRRYDFTGHISPQLSWEVQSLIEKLSYRLISHISIY